MLPSFPNAQNRAGVSRREALQLLGLGGVTVLLATTTGGLRAAETGVDVPTDGATFNAQPGFYRFKIGDIEAVALNDGGFAAPVAQSPFAAGVVGREELIASSLNAAFLATDKVQVPFNVLLVKIGSELVLIDSGAGGAFGPAGGKLVARLASVGVKPEQISALLVSHAHGDHIGGLLDAQSGQPVFKNATHYMGKREFEFWTGAPELPQLPLGAAAAQQMIAGAQGVLNTLKSKLQLIEPGEKLIGGLEVLDAPGHTPGHLAFLVSSGNDQLLHFVDAAHHHALSFAHPEWAFAYDGNPALALTTRKALFDRAAADRLRLFGAHMAFPALGHVKALAGGSYEYVLEPLVVS
jgi:glyoxylase-like metal-dependent hydrolase (beta-lactamase superfamily II)